MISNDERLNINHSLDDEINFGKYISILFRKKKILFFSIFLSTLIIGSLLNRAKPSWQGGFQFILEIYDSNNLENNREDLFSRLFSNSKDSSIQNEISVIKSPLVLLPVYKDIIKTEDQASKFKNINSFRDYQKWLKSVKIEILENSKIIDVKYTNENQEILIFTLEKILEKFQDYSIEKREKENIRQIKYLEEQISKAQIKNDLAFKKLNKFSVNNRLGDLDGFLLNNEYKVNNESEFKSNGNYSQNSLTNNQIAKGNRYDSLFERLDILESEYTTLGTKFKPNSRIMFEKKREIENLKKALIRPNEILLEYRDLQRTAKRNNTTLKNLEDNLALTYLSKERVKEPWEIVSYPVIYDQISPRPVYNYFVTLLASTFAFSITIIIKEKSKGLVYDLDEFKTLLNFNFIGNLKKLDPKYNDIALINFIDKRNLDKKSSFGFLTLNDESPSVIKKELFNKADNFYFHKKNDIEKLIENDYLFIICLSGLTKTQDINKINNYLGIFDKKVLGWFLIEDK